jgi:hypothetical protein
MLPGAGSGPRGRELAVASPQSGAGAAGAVVGAVLEGDPRGPTGGDEPPVQAAANDAAAAMAARRLIGRGYSPVLVDPLLDAEQRQQTGQHERENDQHREAGEVVVGHLEVVVELDLAGGERTAQGRVHALKGGVG